MKTYTEELRKEIIGKEFELNELDNICMKILPTASSIFGYDEKEIVEVGNFAYQTKDRIMGRLDVYDEYVIVKFKKIEDNKNPLKILVKVIEIKEI